MENQEYEVSQGLENLLTQQAEEGEEVFLAARDGQVTTLTNILDPTTSTSYRQSFREQKNLQVRQFLLETNLGATEDIHEVKSSLENLHLKL